MAETTEASREARPLNLSIAVGTTCKVKQFCDY